MQLRLTALILMFLLFGMAETALSQLRKINIAYTATSPYQAVLIVAQEVGLFKKHNLDPTLVFTTGGSMGIQAMLGGDVAMTLSDGSSSVLSKLAGVDTVVIASLLNTFPYSLIALPEIKKVEQLKGAKDRRQPFRQRDGSERKDGAGKGGLERRQRRDALADRRADCALRCFAVAKRAGNDHHAAVHAHRPQSGHADTDRHG